MYTIQSKSGLRQLFSDLSAQDFRFNARDIDEAIQNKVSSIIDSANKLNFLIDKPQMISDTLKNYDDFGEMKRVICAYFDRKTPEDRAREIVNKSLSLKMNDQIYRPYTNYRPEEREKYLAQLNKYNITEDSLHPDENNFRVYRLSQKTIRISNLMSNRYDFKQLVELTTGETCKLLYYDQPHGEWVKVSDSVDIKLYKDSGEVRGNIATIKQYFIDFYRKDIRAVII